MMGSVLFAQIDNLNFSNALKWLMEHWLDIVEKAKCLDEAEDE